MFGESVTMFRDKSMYEYWMPRLQQLIGQFSPVSDKALVMQMYEIGVAFPPVEFEDRDCEVTKKISSAEECKGIMARRYPTYTMKEAVENPDAPSGCYVINKEYRWNKAIAGQRTAVGVKSICKKGKMKHMGCWKDTIVRAMPTLEGRDPRLDGEYQMRGDAISKCYQVALSRGYKYFGLQHSGRCLAGNDDEAFKKYGKSLDCKGEGKGGKWANDIYLVQEEDFNLKTFFSTALNDHLLSGTQLS